MEQARRIVEDTGLELYAGDDNILQPFLELGGVGGICVHTHVVGPQVAEQARLVRSGDVEGARRIDRELAPAYDLLQVAPNPMAIKAALRLQGWDVGGHRLPLVAGRRGRDGRSAQLPRAPRRARARRRVAALDASRRLDSPHERRRHAHHPARRSRRGGQEHDRHRGRRVDPGRRRRARLPARRAARRRPRPAGHELPARAPGRHRRRRAHARPRGSRRRAAVPPARGRRARRCTRRG